jgi:hypothetical protein
MPASSAFAPAMLSLAASLGVLSRSEQPLVLCAEALAL